MANGSGTSFNNPYDTQNGGILPSPYPSEQVEIHIYTKKVGTGII